MQSAPANSSFGAKLRRAQATIAPKKHIFLMSHMRAYTSLLGHIMGSNPEICGYYELHIGYYSFKSLIRQKLIYFENEDVKPGFRYMFDKVLHDDHRVATDLLDRAQCIPVFSLRDPRQTVPSIVNLYQRIDPDHVFATVQGATEYYVKRVSSLKTIAESLHSDYYYIDAEGLTQNSETLLGALSEWFALREPLSEEYQLQRETGRHKSGDSSSRMTAGTIEKKKPDEKKHNIPAELEDLAVSTYQAARAFMTADCAASALTPIGGDKQTSG